MFNCFTLLSMQTTEDKETMARLGISPEKIMPLGNLKYDMATDRTGPSHINRAALGIDAKAKIWVCGSTHPGEEEILFSAFQQLTADSRLFLILAPRDADRGGELLALARRFNLDARTRTGHINGGNVLILDTIGELSFCYNLARLAFVGGSLVACGGHNPIEPAACGVPVLFGSHMEDFSEIARELQNCGGAKTVTRETLVQTATDILTNDKSHAAMAQAGKSLVARHRGGVARHIQIIQRLLQM
jgi:3-deoxy-D-manno-octulosonic-acid transferase